MCGGSWMTTWNTRIPCSSRTCNGTVEAIQVEELNTEFKVTYHFRCTECTFAGTWRQMASSRFPARKR